MSLSPPSSVPSAEPRTADLPSVSLLQLQISVPIGPVQWRPPTPEELAGKLPGFEVLALLGRGGMGAVYQAREVELGRIVALKLLPREIAADERFRRHFRQEAKTMAQLAHPRIATFHGFHVLADEAMFYTMEFVEGTDLHRHVANRSLSPEQARLIACEICEALVYAHGKGVVHRDIKPSNILIDAEGHAKVSDFGIAQCIDRGSALHRLTTVAMFGSQDYTAPELYLKTDAEGQVIRTEVDGRADLYSLGVLLYETLCFELPRGSFEMPSKRLGTARSLDAVISKALQSSPEKRFASAAEMLAALRQARVYPLWSRKNLPGRPALRSTLANLLWISPVAAAVLVLLIAMTALGAFRRGPVSAAAQLLAPIGERTTSYLPVSLSRDASAERSSPLATPVPREGHVARLLRSKRNPAGLGANVLAFEAPVGTGRRGARGLLVNPAHYSPDQDSVWTFTYARSNDDYGIQIVHPFAEGHVLVSFRRNKVSLCTAAKWTEFGWNARGEDRGKPLEVAAQLLPMEEEMEYVVTSRLQASGLYTLSLNGKLLGTAQVASAQPLTLDRSFLVICPTLGPGQAALISGPVDRGSSECRDITFRLIAPEEPVLQARAEP